MPDPLPKVIDVPPPPLVNIRNQRRKVVWTSPGRTVSNVTGLPSEYFKDGRTVGKNYRWTFTGDAPPKSKWPYEVEIAGEGITTINVTNPELTNGGG